MSQQPYSVVERWAGGFLMFHVQLGLGSLQDASELLVRVASTSPVPEGAVSLVVAMIDALLPHAAHLPSATVDELIARRRTLLREEEPPSSDAAIDVIVECFDHEGWTYHVDRDQKKLMVGFLFPFGETRLVCSISPEDELTIFVLEVVQVEEDRMPAVAATLTACFGGVRFDRQEGPGTVTLYLTLPGASELSRSEVREAIVRVNGAAEHLIMHFGR